MDSLELYESVTKETILEHFREVKPETDFEILFPGRTEELAERIAYLYTRLYKVIDRPKSEEIPDSQFLSALMAWKATTTSMSALEIFRRGYGTEALALLRSVVEIAATILHLLKVPSLHDAVLKGRHDPTKSIAPAKKIIPPIGKLYGGLCQFAHPKPASSFPGHVRGSAQRNTTLLIGGGFDTQQAPFYKFLMHNFDFVFQVQEVTIELVFYRLFSDHKYWKLNGKAIVRTMPQEEKARSARRMSELKEISDYLNSGKAGT